MPQPREPITEALELHKNLRDQLVNRIREKELDEASIAEATDMLPSGVSALMRRDVWPLETALRIASGIGASVRFDVVSQE